MFLRQMTSSELIEAIDVMSIVNPSCSTFVARTYLNDEMADVKRYNKQEMMFPSGEPLPRCWLEPGYRGG